MKNISMNIRYYMAEFYGTFVLTFIGVGIYFVSGNHLVIALSVGFAYMIGAYTLDHISHAHFNPLFTLAAWVDGRMRLKTVGIYLFGQVTGALFGYLGHFLLNAQPFFARDLAFSARDAGLFAFVSFILVYIYLAVSEQKEKRAFLGLSVGITYAALTVLTMLPTYGLLSPLRIIEMQHVGMMLLSAGSLALGSLLAVAFYRQLKFHPTPYQQKNADQ